MLGENLADPLGQTVAIGHHQGVPPLPGPTAKVGDRPLGVAAEGLDVSRLHIEAFDAI